MHLEDSSTLVTRGPLRHLGKLGCVRSDPYEPTSTGIGVGRGGAATQNAAHLDLLMDTYLDCNAVIAMFLRPLCQSVLPVGKFNICNRDRWMVTLGAVGATLCNGIARAGLLVRSEECAGWGAGRWSVVAVLHAVTMRLLT